MIKRYLRDYRLALLYAIIIVTIQITEQISSSCDTQLVNGYEILLIIPDDEIHTQAELHIRQKPLNMHREACMILVSYQDISR